MIVHNRKASRLTSIIGTMAVAWCCLRQSSVWGTSSVDNDLAGTQYFGSGRLACSGD